MTDPTPLTDAELAWWKRRAAKVLRRWSSRLWASRWHSKRATHWAERFDALADRLNPRPPPPPPQHFDHIHISW